jgi:hypothetical protein
LNAPLALTALADVDVELLQLNMTKRHWEATAF